MKHSMLLSIALSLVFTISGGIIAVPKVMAVDLQSGQDGVYASEVFHVPVYISDATIDVSVLMDTYMRATLEFRSGNDYVRVHLMDLSVSGHFEYDIFELFARVTSRDVTLTLYVDTDGIIQGVPRVSIAYYGLW